MVKEEFVTEQALVARKLQLENVISKLDLIFDFFKKNKRLPESNPEDKYEMKLYDFFRHLDLSKYENDLDPSILEKIACMKERSKIVKERRKKEKKLKIKREYIFKCIKNYYDFYLENGYFASDTAEKEERRIAKDYYNIIKYSDIFTNEHKYYIGLINDIKKHANNMQSLLRIRKYISFCKENNRFPHNYDGVVDDKTNFDRYESMIFNNYQYKVDKDVKVPVRLEEMLNNTIKETEEKEHEAWIYELNSTMIHILLFMETYNVSPDSKKYYDTKIVGFNNKQEKVSNALKYIKANIKYVDQDLIDKYNTFKFVRKPLNKMSN